MNYTKTVKLDIRYDEAVPKVKSALKERGFGTLSEIDVQATLDEKIGYEMEPYLIIGACNPALASRAIEAEPEIGALLPCNVVVRAAGSGVIVDAMDPAIMASITANPKLKSIADEAGRLIDVALSELAQESPG